ncbi:ATP-binding protein [Pseudomonas sp. NA-150]|uniref:ATP-binding protein n=1 Tax=Pseudomonas sp. NA-150 TaxID=3367525 RepID=UPI0037C95399
MKGDSFSLSFGPFSLELPQRTLSREGQTLRLGSRATDILLALIEAKGELVSRDALIARVWPDTVVDEGALRVHVSSARKVLGDGVDGAQYITNEPGRGYRFIARVTGAMLAPSNASSHALPEHNLPGQISQVLGRTDIVQKLAAQLSERRCLTIAGPGGIGKTTVAIAIAHLFLEQNIGPVCFVDLAPLSDTSSVVDALAASLRIPIAGRDAMNTIIAEIAEGPRLLLLDNCEHLIEQVAPLTERLLQDTRSVQLLITSREPLRAEGEWIHRLATLAMPAAKATMTLEETADFPAVRLFIDRATAVRDDFVLSHENRDAVCDICRQLDGIPLAIEFAAARVDWLSAQAIADHLDSRFKILTKGRRTALPRHQTLEATLDWSFDQLTLCAKAVLRRTSLFKTSFNTSAMIAVGTCHVFDESAVFNTASDLVAKSLLTCDLSKGETQYRYLDTTRHYGLERLSRSGEDHFAKRKHAQYCRDLFVETQKAWDGNARLEWRDLHSRRIDDIRAALDWAFSEDGDIELGIGLVVASSFLWFHLSIANEFFAVAKRALTLIDQTALSGTSLHVDLLTVYGQSRWHTFGPEQAMSDAFEDALKLASTLKNNALEMRAIWGLWMQRLLTGRYVESLDHAHAFYAMALQSGSQGNISTGNNMIALSLHFHGDVVRAIELIELVLADDAVPSRITHANAAQVDGYLSAQTHLMLFTWLHGDVSRALNIARTVARESIVLDHDLTLCAVLTTGAIPVAIWSGDFSFATTMTALLRERAQRHGMRYWDRWGEGFESVLKGNAVDLRNATLMQIETFATMGLDAALDILDAREHHLTQSWAQPELLRRHVLRSSTPVSPAAITQLESALDIAERQSARIWQLRIALSLAEAHKTLGNGEAARDYLVDTLQHFSTAGDNADVQAAQRFVALSESV